MQYGEEHRALQRKLVPPRAGEIVNHGAAAGLFPQSLDAGVEGLDLHHLYRAMAWLGEELPAKEQDRRTPFAPRCLKDVMEERLFAHRRNLFTRLDLVFMDTTSLYFEGAGGQTLGQHRYSKDHRPHLKQMILAVLLDGDGRPVCSEMWPGNTAEAR